MTFIIINTCLLLIKTLLLCMAKLRVGNKENSGINGEYAGHVRRFMKRFTSKKRRKLGKKDIDERQKDI